MLDGVPAGFVLARTSPTFDHETVPAGLLAAHTIADGVWGRLVVHSGSVDFVFEDRGDEPVTVAAGDAVVIPPNRPHHLVIAGSARFAVEFYRPRSD